MDQGAQEDDRRPAGITAGTAFAASSDRSPSVVMERASAISASPKSWLPGMIIVAPFSAVKASMAITTVMLIGGLGRGMG